MEYEQHKTVGIWDEIKTWFKYCNMKLDGLKNTQQAQMSLQGSRN